MGIAARVDGFTETPCFNPSFQLGNRHQWQQGNVRTAALDGIEQGLVFQIADKDVFFVVGQVGVVDAVARNVDFFGTPEKGNLLFNQLFEDFVALLVVARHIDRLAEKHRLFERVVGFFAESAVLHHEMFAGHGGFPWLGRQCAAVNRFRIMVCVLLRVRRCRRAGGDSSPNCLQSPALIALYTGWNMSNRKTAGRRHFQAA